MIIHLFDKNKKFYYNYFRNFNKRKGCFKMAKSSKQNYSLDTTKKIITATISELDAVEKEIVQMYINAGYILHKGKSNPWNKRTIMKWLTEYVSKEKADKFKEDCEDSNIGWVKARKEFFDTYTAKVRKDMEDKAKNKDKEDTKEEEKTDKKAKSE